MLTFMENKGIPKEAAVSVIIPVYNVAAWLDECLRSVVGQTFTDFEAILVDDGSTDGSSELCDEWAKKDFRIRVIHKENAGPSAARNTGILEAKGRYFCFLDSDDWIELSFLQKMYRTISFEQADMAECDVWRVDSITGKKTLRRISGVLGRRYSTEEQMEYGYTAIWKCMFRRELFTENKVDFPDCHSEARALYPLLLCLSKKRSYVPEALYYYRLFRKGSLSEKPRKAAGSRAEGIGAYEILIQNFLDRGLYEKNREILKKLVIHKLSDLLAAFFTQRTAEEFERLTKEYCEFIHTAFPEYESRTYMNISGYNLNKVLGNMRLLHDPGRRINFSSLISLMNPVEKTPVIRHKNRYRRIMLEREADNGFWSLIEEKKPDFIVLDFIEERFDIMTYQGGYLTKSDAFDGCEMKPEPERIIWRDSRECMELWKKSALGFIERMEKDYPDVEIVLVKNYLAEKKGDIYGQEYFADLDEIRKINGILEQYYKVFQQYCKKVKIVEAAECQYYFTDREYEYGAVPSHLNELANREIAGMIEECIGI